MTLSEQRNKYQREWYKKSIVRLRKKQAAYKRKWRKENPEEARLEDKKKSIKYAENRKIHARKYARTYKKDPINIAARTILSNAVKLGRIKKPNKCMKCGKQVKLQGHHPNYDRPLEVLWVCTKCHGFIHHPY